MDTHPATIVVWREAPRCVVDPGPSIRIDPLPLTVAIRCPIGCYVRRIPHLSVVGRCFPIAIVVKVVVADHTGRDMTSRSRIGIPVVARGAVAIEIVRCGRSPIRHAAQPGVIELIRTTGAEHATDPVFAIHRGTTLGNRDNRRPPIGRNFDAVIARSICDECKKRCIDLVVLPRVHRPHPQIKRALRQLDLGCAVVKAQHIERAVGVDAHRRIPEFQCGSCVAAGQESIAGHQRTVAVGAIPLRFAGGRELHVTIHLSQSSHTRWRVGRHAMRSGARVAGRLTVGSGGRACAHGWVIDGGFNRAAARTGIHNRSSGSQRGGWRRNATQRGSRWGLCLVGAAASSQGGGNADRQ